MSLPICTILSLTLIPDAVGSEVDPDLMTDCVVDEIDVGRVKIVTDDGRAISFTGRELEKLHPITRI